MNRTRIVLPRGVNVGGHRKVPMADLAELHVHSATGVGTSKLTLHRIERGDGVRATAGNLNTIDRLIALADR